MPTNLFDWFGGRKNSLAIGVVAFMLTMIGQGKFEDIHLTIAMVLVGVITVFAFWFNVSEKEVIAKNGVKPQGGV